jgi:hypothetical protein
MRNSLSAFVQIPIYKPLCFQTAETPISPWSSRRLCWPNPELGAQVLCFWKRLRITDIYFGKIGQNCHESGPFVTREFTLCRLANNLAQKQEEHDWPKTKNPGSFLGQPKHRKLSTVQTKLSNNYRTIN